MILGQRRNFVALDLVTHTAGERDVAAYVVGAPEIDRHAVRAGEVRDSAVIPFAANRDAAGELWMAFLEDLDGHQIGLMQQR